MCHSLLDNASFWSLLTSIDEEVAAAVRAEGCPCGGALHSARYRRKPRGWPRKELGEDYTSRLSFCCNREGCRRRCTPPSVRFFGRRLYLGAVVTLSMALEHGLTPKRRQRLVGSIGVDPRTLTRWCQWWREQLPVTRVPGVSFGDCSLRRLIRLNYPMRFFSACRARIGDNAWCGFLSF